MTSSMRPSGSSRATVILIEFEPRSIAATTGGEAGSPFTGLPCPLRHANPPAVAVQVCRSSGYPRPPYHRRQRGADTLRALERRLDGSEVMTDQPSVDERLRRSARAEKRLIAHEARAERRLLRARKRLAIAEARLQRVLQRVERRRQRVLAAEEALRACQQARAAGPAQLPAEPEQDAPVDRQPDESANASLADPEQP
jgi:hypothetical protein